MKKLIEVTVEFVKELAIELSRLAMREEDGVKGYML